MKRTFIESSYSKGEKDDLTADEKKLLRRLAERFRSEAIAGTKRKGVK